MKSQNKGITLVALIITIVVLLILATVTIREIKGKEIVEKAQEAKEGVINLQIEEEIKFATLKLQNIEETVEDKAQWLREELEAAVAEGEDRIIISYKGYKIVLDVEYKIQDMFTAAEWDKTATPEEVFRWGSEDYLSPDYGTVTGYNAVAKELTTLKYPSRCTKIKTSQTTNTQGNTNNIKEVYIPRTTLSLEQRAFHTNGSTTPFQKLEKVVIEDGLEKIGSEAFRDCPKLTQINISNNVKSIESYAFRGCTGLTELIIPNSVTSIGYMAFLNCTNIESIVIPKSVVTMDAQVFRNWTSSQKVYVYFDSYSQKPAGWNNQWATNGAQKEYSMNTGEELK